MSSRIRFDLDEVENLAKDADALSDAFRRESRVCPARDLAADVARAEPGRVGVCER
jgi:hypothetical protein